MASAYEGFSNLGAEIVPFYWIDDIDELEDLGPDTIVVGYIGDVWRGLTKMGKAIPDAMDYPVSLTKYLHRDITHSTLGEVCGSDKRMFVKPVEQKIFTGYV